MIFIILHVEHEREETPLSVTKNLALKFGINEHE